jgi:hypothetical protein
MTANLINSQFHVLVMIEESDNLADQVRAAVAYLRSEPTLDLEADEFSVDFPRIGRQLAANVVSADLLAELQDWIITYTPIRWREDGPSVWTHELAA